MKKQDQELTQSLNKIMAIGVYRGILVERLVGAWRVFDKICLTPKQVDEAINEALGNLQDRIKENNGAVGSQEAKIDTL